MPETCSALAHANDSRRRAWREMSRLRRLLAEAQVPVEHRVSPPNFEHEGTCLAAAVSWLVVEYADRLNVLKNALTDLEQTVHNPAARGRLASALAVIKFLLKSKQLPAALVEEMRTLSGYRERDLRSISRAVEKAPGRAQDFPR